MNGKSPAKFVSSPWTGPAGRRLHDCRPASALDLYCHRGTTMTLLGRLSIVGMLSVPVVAVVPTTAQDGGRTTTRKFYVNAFDGTGVPVDDLAPEDLELKEGGKSREVVALRPAKGMMQIALIVDDNGTGLFRAALFRFVQKLQGRAEFAIITVIGQPLKLTDF